MDPQELHDLVRRARGGDLGAYARLVECTQAMVYAVARHVLRDREAARDAAQETYLRVFRRLKDLRDPLAFPGWLRRVAVTTARSLARARRQYFLDAEAAADVPVLDEQEAAWTVEQRAALAGAVLKLAADDRALCDRYYHGGWTTSRLAEDGGVTEAAVRKRLQRLRERLRKEIEMQEQHNIAGEPLPAEMPARVVELLARPRLIALPENPVGGVWEKLKAQLREFEEVEVPEIVADVQLAAVFGEDFARDYLQGIAPIVHRAGQGQFLRPELDVPLLMQLRGRAGPLHVLSGGKVYRDEEPNRTRLQAFHQAELLVADSGLGEWDFMGRLMRTLDALLPGRRLRQEQVSFPLCTRAWEVQVEWEDRWLVVASWGKYNERALRVLGNDPRNYGAVGVSFGLERLACLHYGIDDVRKVGAGS